MSRTPVKVAGTCKAGHTTTRDSEHDQWGRALLTWRGECPVEGCGAKVICRRVKNATTEPRETPSKTTQDPAEPAPPARKLRKVTAYRDAPAKQRAPRANREPASVPATAPIPAVAQPEPAEPEPAEPAGPEPKRARPRRRLSFAGPDTRDSDGWTVPNIY